MNQAILSKPTYVADDQAKTWEYETNSAIEVDRNRWFLAALVMAGVGITCCRRPKIDPLKAGLPIQN